MNGDTPFDRMVADGLTEPMIGLRISSRGKPSVSRADATWSCRVAKHG